MTYVPPDPCTIYKDAEAFQLAYNRTDLPDKTKAVIPLADGRIMVLTKLGPTV